VSTDAAVLTSPATPGAATGAKRRSPLTWINSLYFAQGLPFFAVNLIAQQMFVSGKVPTETITHWMGILSLAWGIRWLWSPLLELAPSQKGAVIAFQWLGALGLALVAFAMQLSSFFPLAVAALFAVSLISATHDVSSDGIYMAQLDTHEQAKYAGWQGAFFNVARFASAGGLLILAGRLEKSSGFAAAWTTIFGLCSAVMLTLGTYHVWALPKAAHENRIKPTVGAVAGTLWRVIVDFLRKPGVWLAILFILLFRASEGQIQTIGPIFLRAARADGGLGLSTDAVGWAYGTAGTIAFILGTMAGGYFAAWLGLRRAMLWLILGMNLPSAAFVFLSVAMPTDFAVIASALSLEMFGYGFGFVGVILYLMQVVAPGRFQTAHYAIGSGVMGLGMSFFRSISGDIETKLGYQNFFIWGLLCAIPVLLLLRFVPLSATTPSEPHAPIEP
jgi:PAT family beta-lactamase induction signal transducer AmpG